MKSLDNVKSLENCSCVVTGGAQGIGEAIAEHLASMGGLVTILDTDADRGNAVADRIGSQAEFRLTDVSDSIQVKSAMEAVISERGGIDVLVNNAGISAYYDAAEMTEQEWDRVLSVDLKGAWLCCREVLPGMRAAKRGSIVNISSIHARMTTRGMFPYAVAKAGLSGLTRSLALDEGPWGIRVNAVCPGYVRTRLVQEYFDHQEDPATAEAAVLGVHPMGRMVKPEEIAAVVGFLASDASSGMTGSEVFVDAGLSARFA